MITKPMLPPKQGYVEIEENGIRKYKRIKTFEDEIISLMVDQEYRLILLELGVNI